MSINKTILGKIVKQAKIKWDKLSEEKANKIIEKMVTPDEARKTVTYGSDIKAVNGIAKTIALSDNEIALIIEDIDNKEEIRNELARKIQNGIRAGA